VKIYSNVITQGDVVNAFAAARQYNHADIYIEEITTWKPRHYKKETPKRTNYAYGTEIFAQSINGKVATGHVPARASGPRDGYPRAASWDDWGYVIAYLYNLDPHARIGFYDNEADFVEKVRKYRRKESTLPFLQVLTNIAEYAELKKEVITNDKR
jgi:hypothetical protein